MGKQLLLDLRDACRDAHRQFAQCGECLGLLGLVVQVELERHLVGAQRDAVFDKDNLSACVRAIVGVRVGQCGRNRGKRNMIIRMTPYEYVGIEPRMANMRINQKEGAHFN